MARKKMPANKKVYKIGFSAGLMGFRPMSHRKTEYPKSAERRAYWDGYAAGQTERSKRGIVGAA